MSFRFPTTIVSLLTCFALLQAGCSGDDGAAGPPGPPGPPAPPPPPSVVDIADAPLVVATISTATAGASSTVGFSLSDGDGNPVVGLPAGAINFGLAKLVPGSDGNSSAWQSYINRIEAANGIGPGTVDRQQAVTESGATGVLADNGDGSYLYTFAVDVTAVADVAYEPDLTHRVGFEIRGFVPIDNPTFDWQPSTGATGNLFSREIVSDASCNTCHEKLALHGGARFRNQYCMVCHNPGSIDAQSGNTVDMTVMTHKIHYGASLPSVVAGGEYAIWGFFDRKFDYSNVVHPQDIRNCANCHDDSNPDTPQAENWYLASTVEACGSCHEEVNFETGENHANGISASNAECTICHAPGSPVGVEEAHTILTQVAAGDFRFNILGIDNTAPGEFPEVTVSITDPNNGDAPYDLLTEPSLAAGGRVVVDIAWNTLEVSNRGSGSGAGGRTAQPVSLNVLATAVDNGDGTYGVTSPTAIPAGVTGSGIVAMEGRASLDTDGDGSPESIPITGVSTTFAITDGVPTPRREIVDLANCNDCHQSLSLHGSNRTDDILLCVTCHNSDATDIAARVRGGADNSNSPDGKDEETIEFKTMIHAIHAGSARDAGYVAYGFFGQPIDYGEVVYPGKLENCEGCHLPDTYYPVGAFALAATIDSGNDLDTPDDDVNMTPNTATCWGCHDRPEAVAHMQANGGAFDAAQTPDGTLVSATEGTVIETCDVCHGPGRSSDVKTLHGIP